MEALGDLSPVDTMRAKIQEKLADFLAARARLGRLMNSPNLQTKGQAQGLYAVQVELERQLQTTIYPKLTAIQSGVWDFSDIATLGGFTVAITKQINDVNGLVARSGGLPSDSFDMTTILMAGGLVLGLGLMGGVFFGRKIA
jgi:hypothetical protein